MKTDLFQSWGHCSVFQMCWHIECITLTASSFRIWNSSTRISSPPLILFIVMLPKAHLTSHSRMSGSWWVIKHCGYLGLEDLFCVVLLCILATCSSYLLLLLGPYNFCPLLQSKVEPKASESPACVALLLITANQHHHKVGWCCLSLTSSCILLFQRAEIHIKCLLFLPCSRNLLLLEYSRPEIGISHSDIPSPSFNIR